MHLIKKEEYFLVFNKFEAENVINKLKDKNLAIIDFESFQLHQWNRAKFKNITITNIPYTVCLNLLTYNQNTNEFSSTNEVVYQFKDDWKNEKELLGKLKDLAVFIADFVEEHKIEVFLFMASFQETESLNFFIDTFKEIPNLKNNLSLKGYDLYKYFYDPSKFSLISYKHSVAKMMKSINLKYNDEYGNQQIGKDGMKHFANMLKGKPANTLNFEKVKEHSLIDLKKGIYLLNYINALANWNDQDLINKDFLLKEGINFND